MSKWLSSSLIRLLWLYSLARSTDAWTSATFHSSRTTRGLSRPSFTDSNVAFRAPQMSKDSLETSSSPQQFSLTPKRLSYGFLWVGLVAYAFGFSPGGSAEAAAKDSELIATILSTPFDGTVSPIFVAVFNALGILPAVFASLLLPGGGKQRVPCFPFVFSSFFLGFFGVGPYLFLREEKTNVAKVDRSFGTAAFEPKLASLLLVVFGVYLLYYAVTAAPISESLSSYSQLFSTQRLVHVSTIDFTILSLAVFDPMTEDMKRRNWLGVPATAFCSLPVIGPALYLVLRPSLPEDI